jgi:hypothetical protein
MCVVHNNELTLHKAVFFIVLATKLFSVDHVLNSDEEVGSLLVFEKICYTIAVERSFF